MKRAPRGSKGLDYALSYTHPREMGEIDKEEADLICTGAYDLVLIENASEVFRQVMMREGKIEELLEAIIKECPSCSYIPSDSFEIWSPNPKYQSEITLDEYEKHVNAVKKHINKLKEEKKTVIVMSAAVLLGDSGHYAAFVYYAREGVVRVFDAMQAGKEGSYYTDFFVQLAQDLFSVMAVVPDCIAVEASLQLTGGFSENLPLALAMAKGVEGLFGPKMSESDEYKLRIQSTESQNHFCYMWSLWYIQLIVLGLDPVQIIELFRSYRVDPLIVIKMYIYSLTLIPQFGFKKAMGKFFPFFEAHFPCIWTNGRTLSLDFKRACFLPTTGEKIKTPKDALLASLTIGDFKLKYQNPTPVPKEISDRYC